MDSTLYNPDYLRSHTGPGGRVIVFAFCRAAGIFLSRLLEVSGDKDLSGICVVALPFGDNISRAGGPDERLSIDRAVQAGVQTTRDAVSRERHVEVYKFYASLIQPVMKGDPVCNSCGENVVDLPLQDARNVHALFSRCAAYCCSECWKRHIDSQEQGGMCTVLRCWVSVGCTHLGCLRYFVCAVMKARGLQHCPAGSQSGNCLVSAAKFKKVVVPWLATLEA
jgi:hypothetical protein